MSATDPQARPATLEEWLVRLETRHPKKIDLGLERVAVVLRRLGLSHPPYAVVTVGGTNGKGSCVALLEAIYRAAGYRVGAYTSPHLWRYNERIHYDGVDASDDDLIALFERIEDARGEVNLSYFETATVAALLYFRERGADVAVLEVGLGGRLDAVNAVDADAVLIASVDVDHTQWLGPDRDTIGYEKAGIARSGRPAVIGDRDPPAGLLHELARREAALRRFRIDFHGEPAEHEGAWRYSEAAGEESLLPCPPFGTREQVMNAAACVALARALHNRLPVPERALAQGLRNARLRGRFERWHVNGVEWVFDIAHNPAAAQVLAAALEAMPAARREHAVVGLMRDKDAAGVLAPLFPRIGAWHAATVASERAMSAAELAALLAQNGARELSMHVEPVAAAHAAMAAAIPGDRVLVFGSFYVVGPVMEALTLYSPLVNRDD